MRAERNLNGLLAVIIGLVLLGAFGLQIFAKEIPCPLCYLQRLGMLGVAAGGLLNLRFGISPAHYGVSLISAIFGGFVALRQIALHVCPGFSTFGKPFWGLSLYTWAFIIFAASVAFIAIMMLIFSFTKREEYPMHLKVWEYFWGYLAFGLLLIVALGNVIATFYQCGVGACQDVL